MSKKDYEKAARLAQRIASVEEHDHWRLVVGTFVEFFKDDSERFNEARFRRACVPGANVKARTR